MDREVTESSCKEKDEQERAGWVTSSTATFKGLWERTDVLNSVTRCSLQHSEGSKRLRVKKLSNYITIPADLMALFLYKYAEALLWALKAPPEEPGADMFSAFKAKMGQEAESPDFFLSGFGHNDSLGLRTLSEPLAADVISGHTS